MPGPEAQQLATYAGWRIGGMTGGLVAGSLFILPGALLVTALAWLHAAGRDVPLVAAALAWGRHPFPAVVAGAAILGWLLPQRDGVARTEPAAVTGTRRGLLTHACAVIAVATATWAAFYAVVWATSAAGGRGPAIARLFTATMLLSFGGAYAIVPWALDESVTRGWLEPGERYAALAMGEATPGPLILVVTFIGFLSGWKAVPAPLVVVAAAAVGMLRSLA